MGMIVLAFVLGAVCAALVYEWRDRRRRDAGVSPSGAGGPGEEQK